MTDLQPVMDALLKFRDERDWKQFHNPKDLAAALSIEAAELQEIFLWKSADAGDVEKVKEELADVFCFSLLIAEHYGFDIPSIVLEKVQANGLKYPIEKAKGSATKYDAL